MFSTKLNQKLLPIFNDASVYEIHPQSIETPINQEELRQVVTDAVSAKLSITLRAGGTSLGGQAIGSGLVIDISQHLTNIISIDNHEVTVEPGVIQDDLNDFLKKSGVHFPPDTSTSNRAMIGGMIGNNSCGSYSIYYGSTREHINALDVILSDGSEVTFSGLSPEKLAEKKKLTTLEGNIYRTVIDILEHYGNKILENYPDQTIKRRNTGYALDVLYKEYQPFNPKGKPFNLSSLICGSEGTLAIVKQAKLNIESLPKEKGLICAHFNSIKDALEVVSGLLDFQPAAIELIDRVTLECTKENIQMQRNRFWIEGNPEAVLIIELFEETTYLLGLKQAEIQQYLRKHKAFATPIIQQNNANKVWAIRKAGLGLLMGKVTREKAVAVIEDAAVPIMALSKYYHDVQLLMAELSVNCIYYGHASVGVIHIRPEIDMRSENGRLLFTEIASRHAQIVKKYKGAISGEHGDGRIRAPYIKEQLGAEVYSCLVALKKVFDPKNILNPGVIIGHDDITNNLRAYRKVQKYLDGGFNWKKDISLFDAVEKCNGAAACRKSAGRGVMCPSYQVTREEVYSTRGRSNLLRYALTEADPKKSLSNKQLQDSLDMCLGCKGCKSECPASVDMARLKSEVLYQTQSPFKLSRLSIKYYASILKYSQMYPLVSNFLQDLPWVKKLLKIDVRRSLPINYSKTEGLQYWWSEYKYNNGHYNKQKIWVLCDLYSQYSEPKIGKAVLKSLIRMGFCIHPIFMTNSPRALISQGLLNEVKKALVDINNILSSVKKDDLIVGIEPSEVLVWRDEADDLVSGQNKINDIYLYEELIVYLQNKRIIPPLKKLILNVKLHVHCHQKSLADPKETVEALSFIPGVNVELLKTGCCGMSGDFGYKHYDVSKKIAEQQLLPAIASIEKGDVLVATGTSCRHQIADFSEQRGLHVAELFAMAV